MQQRNQSSTSKIAGLLQQPFQLQHPLLYCILPSIHPAIPTFPPPPLPDCTATSPAHDFRLQLLQMLQHQCNLISVAAEDDDPRHVPSPAPITISRRGSSSSCRHVALQDLHQHLQLWVRDSCSGLGAPAPIDVQTQQSIGQQPVAAVHCWHVCQLLLMQESIKVWQLNLLGKLKHDRKMWAIEFTHASVKARAHPSYTRLNGSHWLIQAEENHSKENHISDCCSSMHCTLP